MQADDEERVAGEAEGKIRGVGIVADVVGPRMAALYVERMQPLQLIPQARFEGGLVVVARAVEAAASE